MKLRNSNGFTIIETMLFLAISGFLFVAILAGTGNAINIQRYRDSVYSLQSFIQKQYSEVVNVSNESGENKCSLMGNTAKRGQSDCVILGRFITTAENGGSLKVYKVIGIEKPIASVSDDISVFTDQYTIQLYTSDGLLDVEDYNFEWGVSLKHDRIGGPNVPSVFSILILRSPNSGNIRTFTDISSEVASDKIIQDMANSLHIVDAVKTCVDSNGLISATRSAVLVHANAAAQSDIEVFGDKDSGC